MNHSCGGPLPVTAPQLPQAASGDSRLPTAELRSAFPSRSHLHRHSNIPSHNPPLQIVSDSDAFDPSSNPLAHSRIGDQRMSLTIYTLIPTTGESASPMKGKRDGE